MMTFEEQLEGLLSTRIAVSDGSVITSADRPILDVLLIESQAHVGDEVARQLAVAGHRVHRCQDQDSPDFPCRALTQPGSCPLDGHIDVAVITRGLDEPRPTRREGGVTCAVRARVPLVEVGSGLVDPFARWVTLRVDPATDDNTASACATAVVVADTPLRSAVHRTVAALVSAAGMEPSDVRCDVVHDGRGLHVHVTLPTAVARAVQQAIGVRVLDAVREASTSTVGNVDVFVHPTSSEVQAP